MAASVGHMLRPLVLFWLCGAVWLDNLEWCSRQCTCLNNYRTVDCARRSLDEVPDLSNLTVNLYLENNQISALSPDTLHTLDSLMMLNMEGNLITKLSAEYFCSVPNLQVLNLGRNQLRSFSIPDNVTSDCRLPALKTLILSNNRLTELPANLAQFTPSLKTLNVSFNMLSSVAFNGSFSALLSLRELDLRSNNIFQILLDDFGWLQGIPLNTLSLSECSLLTIEPGAFRHMTELSMLSLSRNLIGHTTLEAIFSAIGNSSQLAHLELSDMFLPNLTLSMFGMLTRLNTLDVHDSSVRLIEPALFDNLPLLERLNIGHNELRQLLNISALKKLRWLHAQWNHLGDLDLGGLEQLELVDLSGNKLETLPRDWLGAKEKLQLLNVSYNEISSVDRETFLGLSLQHLDLSHNQLTSLDGTALKRLRKLNLSNNHLTQVTASMFTDIAGTLWDVNLSRNNISAIREGVFEDFVSLQECDLSYNRLGGSLGRGELAALFTSMGHLQQIDLSGNEIITVRPGQWRHLHHVNTVSLSHNHVRSLKDASLPELKTVARLVLAHNELGAIDVDTLAELSYLEEVEFSNNPFMCTECAALPFIRWLNHSAVRVLGVGHTERYHCYMPPELTGLYLLDYHPAIADDTDCTPRPRPIPSPLDWTMIGIAVAGVVVFLSLVAVLFFYGQLCHKIKSLHYRWQIRYREVSGVEFTNDPKV